MAKHTAHLLLHTLQPGNIQFGMGWANRNWRPRADIYRTQDALLIAIEAAGINEADVELHFEPGSLTVEGRRRLLDLPPEAVCHQVELDHGRFRRDFDLPREADGERITARFESGLLIVTIPLRTPAPPKTLQVEIS